MAFGFVPGKLGIEGEEVAAIRELGRQLSSPQSSVNDMRRAMDAGFDALQRQIEEVKRLITTVQLQQLYDSWRASDNIAQGFTNQIDTQYKRLLDYTTTAKSVPRLIDQLVGDTLSTTNGAEGSLNGIHNRLMPAGSAKGVLTLWREMISPLVSRGMILYGQAVQNYLDYYSLLVTAQQRAVHLLIEAYNKSGLPESAKRMRETYRNLMTKQEGQFLGELEHLLLAGNSREATRRDRADFIDFTYDHYRVAQSVYAGGLYNSFYAPSPERAAAEELLASAYSFRPDNLLNVANPPQAGGDWGTIYFVDPRYLAYQLQVDALQPSDFMDFVVWAGFYKTAQTVKRGTVPVEP